MRQAQEAINALDGQPFFVVNQAVDPGLLRVLENEIVPAWRRRCPLSPALSNSPPTPGGIGLRWSSTKKDTVRPFS
ncbi:MAG: hypothetical protein ACREV4_01380 [Gammaproteobacteria bacterium]